MKRITTLSLVCSASLLTVLAGAAFARPVVNGAIVTTRTFNDCPVSTVTTTNNFPASIEITDAMDTLCVGFANLHSWSFSEDAGATAAAFNNNSNFRFGADVSISGAGQGEGGLRISPWYGQFVDGRFMINATTGEIACFGGTLPFYSFTVNHGITYTRGATVHMEMTYRANDLTSVNPATIQYHIVVSGIPYDSPILPFGEQNPNECNTPQHNGQWGMLNDGRVGAYFQPRANTGASLTARWSNISYEQLPANDGTPNPDAALITLRTFNDCTISSVSSTNNYPASVSITDVMDPLCVGFANLHSWSFSDDGGATAARFDNNSIFRFGADVKIEGAGEGEGGLRLSPWYGQFVDGRFMANATTGEIACFGGALPFYSFTVNHGITYTKGTTIRFEETYNAHEMIATNPATIQYRVIYNGNTYDSPVLPFGEQNPNECNSPQYNDLFGMLNDGRVGGYFQPRANTGAALTATWSNITYEKCQVEASVAVFPHIINLNSKGKWVTVVIEPTPPTTPADLNLSSILINGSVPLDLSGPVSIGDDNGNGIPDISVKVLRSALAATYAPGDYDATLTVSGAVAKGCFQASADVHIKHATLSHPAAGSLVAPGQVVDLSWTPMNAVQRVSVTRSIDNGATWTVDADGVANSGSYHWTAPDVSTTQARVAVVQLRNGGPETEAELTESGTFTISSTTGVGDGVAMFALGRVAPNPTGSKFDVSFSLPSGAPATLAVFDVSGRRIANRDVGGMGAGIHVVTFGDAARLRPGLYMVRLNQLSKSLTTPVLVLP
jgi:hypothetical protein